MSTGAPIGTAYDSVAAAYDGHLARDRWMRRVLWRHFDRLFRAGDRVLDAGCGTGIDTLHLAARGIHVTAVDASAGMLARLREKLAAASNAASVEIVEGELVTVAARLPGPLDGIVSSFAALNTVDLGAFARASARLLRPGGRLVCHLLAPRAGAPAETLVDVAGSRIAHLLLPPDDVYERFFASAFSRRATYALGMPVTRWLETRLAEPFLNVLGRLEAALTGAVPALRPRGRFFVLDLERRAAGAERP